MLEKSIKDALRQVFYDLDEEACQETVKKALDQGADPMALMEEMTMVIQEVGDRFSEGEIFLPELILSGDMMQSGVEIIKEALAKLNIDSPVSGKIVLGSVKNDIHDIGKDIVKALFTASGFKVFDVGIDAPTESFIETAEENHVDIIALSATMSTTLPPMKEVMEHLKVRGIRDKYKILVGGGSVTAEFAKDLGADGYGADANEAVVAARKVLS